MLTKLNMFSGRGRVDLSEQVLGGVVGQTWDYWGEPPWPAEIEVEVPLVGQIEDPIKWSLLDQIEASL